MSYNHHITVGGSILDSFVSTEDSFNRHDPNIMNIFLDLVSTNTVHGKYVGYSG